VAAGGRPSGHDFSLTSMSSLRFETKRVAGDEVWRIRTGGQRAGQVPGLSVTPYRSGRGSTELDGEDAVSDAFKVVVRQWGSRKAGRITFVARVVMRDVADAVEQGIAQPHVGEAMSILLAEARRAPSGNSPPFIVKQIEMFREVRLRKGESRPGCRARRDRRRFGRREIRRIGLDGLMSARVIVEGIEGSPRRKRSAFDAVGSTVR